MHIENHSAYTPPLYTRATDKAANENAGQASTPSPSGNRETAAADTAKAAPVTGVTGSNLSKEVMDQLIAAAQETGAPNTDTEKYDGPLSKAERHGLEDIASNPEYAAKQAELFGTLGEFGRALQLENGVIGGLPGGANYEEKAAKRTSDMAKMEQVREQRTAYYESLKGQGLPPAKIFAKLLEFNANLPESYDDTLGWSDSGRGRPLSYSEYNKAKFDYLQNLIDQGNAATASTKTTTSSETNIQEDKSVPSGNLTTSDKDLLTKIFNNPDYARKGARNSGQYGYAPFISNEEFPKNGAPVRVLEKFAKLNKYRTLNASVMQAKRFDFYKSEIKKGISPAQLYANILQFNADLPQSYWSSIGYNQGSLSSTMKYARFQEKHDYLQNLINQGNAATASVKTADSTKAAG